MKKTLCFILAVSMIVFIFAGCSKKPGNKTSTTLPSTRSTTMKAETETPNDAESTNQNENVEDGVNKDIESGTQDEQTSTGSLKIHYINVGNGDSILIQAPTGKTMLIDGGSNSSEGIILEYLKEHGIHKLDYIIASHPHEENIGGLDAVIREFEVSNIYAPNIGSDTSAYEDFLFAAKEKKLKIQSIKSGTGFDMGEDIAISALSPISTNYNNLNNYSAVIRLVYRNTSFLFTGDAEEQLQKQILSKDMDVSANVLKVSNQGGINSISPEFLSSVAPIHAVISVGKSDNDRFPYVGTLNMLSGAGVQMYRTDVAGDIVAESDGENITFDKEPYKFTVQTPPPSQP